MHHHIGTARQRVTYRLLRHRDVVGLLQWRAAIDRERQVNERRRP